MEVFITEKFKKNVGEAFEVAKDKAEELKDKAEETAKELKDKV